MFEVHSFRVDEVVAGDGRPEAASFLAWTSPKRADAFREEAGVCDEVRAVSWKDWNGPGDYIDSELFRRYQAQHDAVPAKIEMYRPGVLVTGAAQVQARGVGRLNSFKIASMRACFSSSGIAGWRPVWRTVPSGARMAMCGMPVTP